MLVYQPMFYYGLNPRDWPGAGGGGVKSRMYPPYPKRDRKRRLNGAVCWNHRIKRVGPVSVLGRAR